MEVVENPLFNEEARRSNEMLFVSERSMHINQADKDPSVSYIRGPSIPFVLKTYV